MGRSKEINSKACVLGTAIIYPNVSFGGLDWSVHGLSVFLKS